MDFEKDLFPICVVWTILPCITWIIPWIGHTGICQENGRVNDFLGYQINKSGMAFGKPVKYVQLDISDISFYNECLEQANKQFSQQAHDLCCNNCHHHVARVLNLYQYRNRTNWTQVSIWWMCLWESKYVSWFGILKTYLPFLVICIALAVIFHAFKYV